MTRTFSLIVLLALATACVSTNVATNVNGLQDNDGQGFAHQETSIWALHWVFGVGAPIVEDASF